MPRFDLLEHDLYVGSRKPVSRRIGNGAQLGIDGPGIIAPGLPKSLSNPLCDGHAVPAGFALNLSVLFLIEENLKSLWHVNSVLDSWNMSQRSIFVDLYEFNLYGSMEIKTTSASPGITYRPDMSLSTIGFEGYSPPSADGGVLAKRHKMNLTRTTE